MLHVGTAAPLDIPLKDGQGETVTLGALLDDFLVVYFYPKDLTPGCTIEALEFQDTQDVFRTLNARVVGVSKDSCASHQKFIAKKQLSFSLLSDPEHVLMDAFGVWGERSFMGKKYMGTSRSTFLIGSNGTIVYVWEKVTPIGHAQEVLEVLREVG